MSQSEARERACHVQERGEREGASKSEARERARPRVRCLRCEWEGVALRCRRRLEGHRGQEERLEKGGESTWSFREFRRITKSAVGTSPDGATHCSTVHTRHYLQSLPLPPNLPWYFFLFLLIPADCSPFLTGAQGTLACKREWDACCALLLTNARCDAAASWFVFFFFIR